MNAVAAQPATPDAPDVQSLETVPAMPPGTATGLGSTGENGPLAWAGAAKNTIGTDRTAVSSASSSRRDRGGRISAPRQTANLKGEPRRQQTGERGGSDAQGPGTHSGSFLRGGGDGVEPRPGGADLAR